MVIQALLLVSTIVGSATGVNSGHSSISFCVSDKVSSNLYYLTDLTAPVPGQSVSEDQYTQGRLVLGGSFLMASIMSYLSSGHNNKI